MMVRQRPSGLLRVDPGLPALTCALLLACEGLPCGRIDMQTWKCERDGKQQGNKKGRK